MKPFFTFCLVSISVFVCAQQPELVKDINPGSGHGNPLEITGFGNKVFFEADDGIHGEEPWTSNGTESGTQMVEDIDGVNGYQLHKRFPTVLDGKVYFVVNEPINGAELWVLDENGVEIVENIGPGNTSAFLSSSTCGCMVVYQGELYFNPRNGAGVEGVGIELWKTSNGNTELVQDIHPGKSSGLVDFLVVMGDQLFFSAQDGIHGTEIWVYDGSLAKMIKDIRPGSLGSQPKDLVVAGDKVFFTAFDGTNGRELWVTDGTEEGTFLVENIGPGDKDGNIDFLAGANGKAYFRANDDVHGHELWVSDGITTTLYDLVEGTESSRPSLFTAVAGKVFFAARDGNGRELWVHDGSGPHMVENLHTGASSSNPAHLTAVGDILYFSATGAQGGLLRSDGTPEGTYNVAGEAHGLNAVRSIGYTSSHVYFNANGYDFEGELLGYELFRIAHTANINPTNTEINISLYPNPSKGKVVILMDQDLTTAKLKLFNLQGQLMAQPPIVNNAFSTNDLPSGLYYVLLLLDEKQWVQKLIIQE